MKLSPTLLLALACWLVLALGAWYIEFLAVLLIISAFGLIFINTGRRTSGPRYELAIRANQFPSDCKKDC